MPLQIKETKITQPARTFKTDFGRFYSHPASGVQDLNYEGPYKPNPSVTNVMKVLDEGFLPGLYAKKVAEYVVDNLDSVAYWQETFGRSVAIGNLKAVPDRPHPNAAIGDEVHEAIDCLLSGGVVFPQAFGTITAKRMFASFKGFMELHQPKHVRSEATVWNYTHGYAGTTDLLWDIPELGGLGLVDMKTGVRIWGKTGMQCAALAHGESLLAPDGAEGKMPEIKWQGILHVRPMSAKLYVLEHTDENFQAFLACLTLFNWQRLTRDTVIPTRPVLAYPPANEPQEWDGVRRWG